MKNKTIKNKVSLKCGARRIRDDVYIKMNNKEKKKTITIIDKIFSRYGIKNYLIFGFFVTRKYFLEDIKRFEELQAPIKFSAITKGIGRLNESLRTNCMKFALSYMDFQEWLRKWI